MGRTVPTFRQQIEQAVERWAKFRRALRREDQEHFDRLFLCVRSYTQAATYQASDNPMEAILLSIALDQEKRLRALEQRLWQAERDHATARPTTGPITRMDPGPLPQPAGDDPVADRREPETPPID